MKSGFYHNTPLAFAIFGGTGDLTKRKLIPALFSLVKEKRISDEISIVLVGRRNKDVIEFKEELLEFVKAYSRHKVKKDDWEAFAEKINYCRFDFEDEERGYNDLAKILENCHDRIFIWQWHPGFLKLSLKTLKNTILLKGIRVFREL